MNSDNTSDIIATGTSAFAQTYAQLPIVIASGAGCTVTDTDGKTYLDFVAGIAVNALGYGDTDLAKALHAVIDAGITHCSNLYWNTPAVTAAASLVRLSGLKKVFFCNSGAEANEAALKLARKYGHLHKGPNANMVISMQNSFHGRTYGAVTATGQQKYHKGFAPMMPDIAYAQFNDLESVKQLVSERTCAILVEPIQGEGGIIPAERAFLEGLRACVMSRISCSSSMRCSAAWGDWACPSPSSSSMSPLMPYHLQKGSVRAFPSVPGDR